MNEKIVCPVDDCERPRFGWQNMKQHLIYAHGYHKETASKKASDAHVEQNYSTEVEV